MAAKVPAANEADAAEDVEGVYEEATFEEDEGLDRAAELSSFFSSVDGEQENDEPRAPDDGCEVDNEDCATHVHSADSCTDCLSATCSTVDPDLFPDYMSSTCPSARPSFGGFFTGAGGTSCGGGLLHPNFTATPTTPGARARATSLPGTPSFLRHGSQVGAAGQTPPPAARHSHSNAHQARPSTDLLAELMALPEYEGETLDVDVMRSGEGGGCQFVSFLGKGSFGLVDLVRLTHRDGSTELAARKTLPHRDVHSMLLLRAMQAATGSPFTVHYLGSSEYLAERSELFMEYAEGGTLEQELEAALVAQHPTGGSPHSPPCLLLPLERIRVVSASLLLALSELHAQGFAHLALERPRHVLLSATGRVLLGGLSSAARVGSRDHLGRLLGAACCTAPELLRRSRSGKPPRVMAEADLYSLGVLTGLCAFGYGQQGVAAAAAAATAMGPAATVVEGVLGAGEGARRWGDAGVGAGEVPEWVPIELRDFISALMSEEPQQRPTLEEALGHPFLAGLGEEDVLL